jgi:hypothetical protein
MSSTMSASSRCLWLLKTGKLLAESPQPEMIGTGQDVSPLPPLLVGSRRADIRSCRLCAMLSGSAVSHRQLQRSGLIF